MYVNSAETIGPTGTTIDVIVPVGAANGQLATVALWCGANAVSDTFSGTGFTQLFPSQAIGAHGVMTLFGAILDGTQTWTFEWQTNTASEALACLNSQRQSTFSIVDASENSGTQPPIMSGTDLDGDDLIYYVVEFAGIAGLNVPNFINRIDDSAFGMHLWTADNVPAGNVNVVTDNQAVSTQWWPGLIGAKQLITPPKNNLLVIQNTSRDRRYRRRALSKMR